MYTMYTRCFSLTGKSDPNLYQIWRFKSWTESPKSRPVRYRLNFAASIFRGCGVRLFWRSRRLWNLMLWGQLLPFGISKVVLRPRLYLRSAPGEVVRNSADQNGCVNTHPFDLELDCRYEQTNTGFRTHVKSPSVREDILYLPLTCR